MSEQTTDRHPWLRPWRGSSDFQWGWSYGFMLGCAATFCILALILEFSR